MTIQERLKVYKNILNKINKKGRFDISLFLQLENIDLGSLIELYSKIKTNENSIDNSILTELINECIDELNDFDSELFLNGSEY